MDVPRTAVCRERFTGPGAWRRSDFRSPGEWNYHLSPETVAELDCALRSVRSRGKDISTMTDEDFPLPSFAGDAARLLREVQAGRGFVVIKGLRVDRYTAEEACFLYWGIGSFFGRTLTQNVKGDRLYAVRDEGYNLSRDYGTVGARFSKTTSELNFHTDSAPLFQGRTPDIVGLLALQTAKSGGETAILSAQTIHNVILEERPDHLDRLYAPYHFDRRAELPPGESPTLFAPIFTYNGGLQIRHFPFYIYRGPEVTGIPLTAADTAPLEFLDRVAVRPELAITFAMERGDIQLVNNTFILHSRTAYEDYPDPDRRRHLVRLWLEAGDCRQM